ncbi:hypothetical protein QO011_007576 [Labrys wisconsinensis]|uniref:Transposase DDE domain-containing protein n=1 Tax=Labrys wisconsinensis TaxID=425677 RepID=A0ABU0JJT0_9HYPH|nr:hypothetical protein [Labrys wisconsinensis]
MADFDGGLVSSDAGALLLGDTDKAIGLIDRFTRCFRDRRNPLYTVHRLKTLLAQRVFGLALGYEDLVDHDQLRHDPVLCVLLGKLERHADAMAPLAGKSTLNRLEHMRAAEGRPTRYHEIDHDGAAIERLFVDVFLEAHGRKAPRQIVLDLDATDDPLTATRKGASPTAIPTATAICRCISSVTGICSPPSYGARTSMRAPTRWRRSSGSSSRSGCAGRTCGSRCGPIPALPARR